MRDRGTSRARRLVIAILAIALAALLLTGVGSDSTRDRGEQGEAFSAFAREHPGLVAHNQPLALIRERMEGGEREGLRGPAQEAVDQRAYPRSYVETERAQAARRAYARKARRQGRAAVSNPWEQLGPVTPSVPAQVTYTGAPTITSGRVTAMAIDPNCGLAGHGCRLWVAAAGGGIWRTPDAMAEPPSWRSVDAGLTTNAFGSLVVDPNDPSGNTLYAGSGEANGSADSEAGVGLFKSTDGGDHWSLVPGSVAVSRDRAIGAIAVEPGNPSHLYVGTAVGRHGMAAVAGGRRTPPNAPELGLYESGDGGQTFTRTFSQAASSKPPAGGLDYFQGGVNQIAIDPWHADTVYVAMFGYGIWRRKPGQSFTQTLTTRSPADNFGDRTEFSVVKAGGQTRMYAADSSTDPTPGVDVWRTNDARGTAGWTKLSSTTPGASGYALHDVCGFQCSYNLVVAADSSAPDTVYVGGQMDYDELFGYRGGVPWPRRSNGRTVVRSENAGATFTDVTNDAQSAATGMHPDQHAIAFHPRAAGVVFFGSDGGVVRSDGGWANRSGDCAGRGLVGVYLSDCQAWLSKVPNRLISMNDGLATLQFQAVAHHPSDPTGEVLAGAQDNGTWSWRTAGGWAQTIGGDGGLAAIDGPTGVRVHSYTGGSAGVSYEGGAAGSWLYVGDPIDQARAAGERFSFYAPLIADPRAGGTLFTAGEYVWRTRDDGGPRGALEASCRETATVIGEAGHTTCGDWVRIGNRLSPPDADDNDPYGGFVSALERAPSDGGTLWAGLRRGGLRVSRNADASPGSVSFADITSGGMPDRFVSAIVVDPADRAHAWIAYSGYEAYTPGKPGHVFEARLDPNGTSATFTNVSYDLGDQPVTDLARDDATGDLYAATDFGVLRLEPGATQWQQASSGLPLVAVYGLSISPSAGVLYAATHGRGLWRLPLRDRPPGGGGGGTPPGGGQGGSPSGGTSSDRPSSASKPRLSRLSAKRVGRRRVRVTVYAYRLTRLRAAIRDERGTTIGRRTLRIRRTGKLVFSVAVRPRRAVTRRTRWRVSVVAERGTERASLSVRFQP